MNKRPGGDVLMSITGEVGPEVAFYCSVRFSRLPGWQRDRENASYLIVCGNWRRLRERSLNVLVAWEWGLSHTLFT